MGPTAPWLDPELLPAASLGGEWGVHWHGESHPMSLDAMLAALRREDPKDVAPIRWVEGEGAPRVRPIQEVPAFWPVLAEAHQKAYDQAVTSEGRSALLLGVVCAALLAVPLLRAGVLLPAIFFLQALAAFVEARGARRLLREDPGRYFQQRALEARYAVWLGATRPVERWRIYVFAAAWILLFALQALVGMEASVARAALVKPLVHAGEPWRLLTGTMLHGNLMHIFMNVSAWLSLAPLVERSASRHLLPVAWLLSALGGSLASLLLLPQATSVGASGGLMGLLGFLAVMGWRRRALLPPDLRRSMLRSIGLMAVFGALAWTVIDNAGHGGGLITGALIGAWVFRGREGSLPMADTPALRAAGWAALLACLALAVFTGAKLLALL
ncbi:MAG: rhomboid family intramembrane serine protease [Holophagaceae bacterium]